MANLWSLPLEKTSRTNQYSSSTWWMDSQGQSDHTASHKPLFLLLFTSMMACVLRRRVDDCVCIVPSLTSVSIFSSSKVKGAGYWFLNLPVSIEFHSAALHFGTYTYSNIQHNNHDITKIYIVVTTSLQYCFYILSSIAF